MTATGPDDDVTVGEVRDLLARAAGIPPAEDSHYAIAATGNGGLNVLTCCDGVDEVIGLFRGALTALGSGVPSMEPSASVIARRDDLQYLLAHVADEINGNPDPAHWHLPMLRESIARLSAVAGVTR
jgi:hypothetical protein